MTTQPLVYIESSGKRHEPAPVRYDLYYDVQAPLHNPAADPTMRFRTGRDEDVRQHVLGTLGARELIERIVSDVVGRVDDVRDSGDGEVRVVIQCAGGRHRAPVVADAVAEALRGRDIAAGVKHRDIDKPVLAPATT